MDLDKIYVEKKALGSSTIFYTCITHSSAFMCPLYVFIVNYKKHVKSTVFSQPLSSSVFYLHYFRAT